MGLVILMKIWIFCLLWAATAAYASSKDRDSSDGGQTQEQGQGQVQHQSQMLDQTAVGGETTIENSVSPSTSVTTTTSNKYKEAPRAYAGSASAPTDIDCRTIYGFDFRGATDDGAGGATFGIPGRERGDCKFERQAARAFAKGDLELGWANHCRSPTNLESLIMVARTVHDEVIDKDQAFKRCMEKATVPEPAAGQLQGVLLAESAAVQMTELRTAIAVLRAELEGERRSLRAQRRSLEKDQQQAQQQQEDASAYVATRVNAGEKRRAESRAYLEQAQAIKLEVRQDGPEG